MPCRRPGCDVSRRQRCAGTVTNTKSERFGEQCKAWAIPGSSYCNKHGGNLRSGPGVPETLAHRCIRRKKNGEQCRNSAVLGSTVCRKHGINKFALAKAQERLASFADPALTVLYDLLTKPETSDADRGRYALAIIDRVGLGPRAHFDFEVELKPWEVAMQHIIRELPEDYERKSIERTPGDTIIDAEVVEDEDESDPRASLARIVPPQSATERATYVRPERAADPPPHLV